MFDRGLVFLSQSCILIVTAQMTHIVKLSQSMLFLIRKGEVYERQIFLAS